jgi:hypothetical protein
MEELCVKYNLLNNERDVIRLPFLIKGKLVIPPEIDRSDIISAFEQAGTKATYIKTDRAQVLREPVIDRRTMRYAGGYVYQVMPLIDAAGLVETDYDSLTDELYQLRVEDILQYLETIQSAIFKNGNLAARLIEMARLTSEFPDAFLDDWAASITVSLDREAARRMIDSELSYMGKPGSDFLNGWAEVGPGALPGEMPCVRAMPTRQLHITAGNAPEVPLVSALRAVLTKSSAVIKLPYGATLTGAFFSLAAATSAPDHPITKNLSMVYWPGGEESVESILFAPGAFDRIVVWGSPETVISVRLRTPLTRTVCFNPRYGVSLVGREVFDNNLEEAAARAADDVMIYDQKACTSSLVQYVEGQPEQVNEYAQALGQALNRWDIKAPGFTAPSAVGRVKTMRRGKYAGATWYVNSRGESYSSAVAVIPGEFDILDHPMCRLAVIHPVPSLDAALKYLSQNVSTAGVYPEKRRLELRDRILSRGVSNVLPLGQCGRVYSGMPHDGMLALNELVDWKNG